MTRSKSSELRTRPVDDGLSYMACTEQITFLLFLKMADEQSKPPYNRPPTVPAKCNWESLLNLKGDELEAHYRHILEENGKQQSMLGEIFKKARPENQSPATDRPMPTSSRLPMAKPDAAGSRSWLE